MDIRDKYDILATQLFDKNLNSISKKNILIDLVEVWFLSLNTYDVDITDAIEIEIFEEGIPEILEYLREKRRLYDQKYITDTIDSWINKILQRSKG